MAKSPANVKKFLSELDNKLTPLAKRDLDLLLKLKEKDCERDALKFDGKINMWDFRFYMDQYVKQHCAIDSEKVREFFPLDHVTNELLAMYQEILSLRFAEIAQPHVWHKDVRMFAVYDARPSRAGRLVGHFYLDLFPRQGKYGHAACFTLQQSCLTSANVREVRPSRWWVGGPLPPDSRCVSFSRCCSSRRPPWSPTSTRRPRRSRRCWTTTRS